MNFDTIRLESMRRELTKLATEGYGRPAQEYEELTKPRLIQALKDAPIALLGTAAGYGIGRTGAEYLMPKIFQTPAAHEALKRGIGVASATAGGLGSFFLAQQHRMMKDRRDAAQRASEPEAGGTEPIIDKARPMQPENAPVDKLSGAIVPAVAQARRIDPWREDRRYPKFQG